MKIDLKMSLISIMAISYLTGCGGGSDPTVPKSVISNISDNFTIVRGDKIKLDASSSTDDIEIVQYTWKVDDSVVSHDKIYEYVVKDDFGSHKICLTTQDKDEKTNTTCKTIKVIEPKIKNPTAVINNIPAAGWKTKCSIKLNAKSSKAIYGNSIKKYEWFKDGKSIGENIEQSYKFKQAGEHNITLVVTDNAGLQDSYTKMVNIKPIGHPTAKLSIVNVFNKPIFSGETNQNGKIWNMDSNDKNLPYKSNYVFLSAEGSFDDCNLTDDNLSYKWDASIYDDHEYNKAPGGIGCFHNKSELRNQIMDFNGSQIVAITDPIGENQLGDIDPNNDYKGKYKYPYFEVANGTIGGWKGWKNWKNETWEKAYISMCSAHVDYSHLKITLTVIDNLHDINTTVTKVIKTLEPKQKN